jgi:hypothetical protein
VTVPGYWMNETSGVLRPAVEAYLNGKDMTPGQILAMRAYLRQWINNGSWKGPMLDPLRTRVEEIVTRKDIHDWLEMSMHEGIDPL